MTEKTYNQCVKEWADNLYRFALKNVRNYHEAQDIVQSSFETLWHQKDKVSPEKAKAFLFTICYRRCMDYFRNLKAIDSIEGHNKINKLENNEQYEWKEYLNKALDTLDDQSRTLILLKDLEGYKYDEIASITNLSLDQVKVYLHRARKQLKNFLQPKS